MGANANWEPVESENFQYDDGLALWTVTIDPADSELGAELLLDPLPLLIKNIDDVDQDWTVTLERVNANVGVLRGPRKLVGMLMVVRPLQRVHGVIYRVTE